MEDYVKADSVYIEEIPSSVAKKMIIEKHYTHAFSMCRYALGIYYVGEKDHTFYDEKEKKLIGCMTYGYPVGRSAVKSMLPTLEKEEVLELTRLYIDDGYGKNIESLSMGKSFKWLKQNASNIKMLISYADPEQMHLGTIYQATNWLYQDCRDIQLMPNYSVSLSEPHKWIHSRTVFSRYGSHNVEHLKNEIGQTFYRKKEAPKHRYLYFLGSSRENKKMRTQLKHDCKAYPKNKEEFIPPIEKYEVENTNKTKSMERYF